MSSIDITKGRPSAFQNALVNSEVGDEIVYSIGLFCSGPFREEALKAYEAGFVLLYQRRHERGFAYTAKRIKK